jgi:hypothetical protein
VESSIFFLSRTVANCKVVGWREARNTVVFCGTSNLNHDNYLLTSSSYVHKYGSTSKYLVLRTFLLDAIDEGECITDKQTDGRLRCFHGHLNGPMNYATSLQEGVAPSVRTSYGNTWHNQWKMRMPKRASERRQEKGGTFVILVHKDTKGYPKGGWNFILSHVEFLTE